MSDATGALVDTIRASLQQDDAKALADALERLLTLEPARWRQLLHLGGIWPDPSPQKAARDTKKIGRYLGCMMTATKSLLDREGDYLDAVTEIILTLQACYVFQGYYDDITAELKKLTIGKSPVEVQVHRLVAFIESQSRTAYKKIEEHQQTTGTFDPMDGLTAMVPTKFDDSKVSYVQAIETLCENCPPSRNVGRFSGLIG